MVSERKKAYMREYNRRPEVRARKAAWMRAYRARADKEAARALVRLLLDLGYENLAYEYALERAPEMLAMAKIRPASTRK